MKRGEEARRDGDPLVCCYLTRHLTVPSTAHITPSLSKAIQPLAGILFEAEVATRSTSPKGKKHQKAEPVSAWALESHTDMEH